MKTQNLSFATLQKRIMKKVAGKKIKRFRIVSRKKEHRHPKNAFATGFVIALILLPMHFLFTRPVHNDPYVLAVAYTGLLLFLCCVFTLCDIYPPQIQFLTKRLQKQILQEQAIKIRSEVRILVENEINCLRNDLIGEDSEFFRHWREIEKEFHSALTVREQLAQRARTHDTPPEYIQNMLADLDQALERRKKEIERLTDFRSKVLAFIKELYEELKGIDPILHEMELIRSAQAFCEISDEREKQTEQVMENVTTELSMRLEKLQTRFRNEIENISKGALAQIHTGSAEKDIKLIEQVSRELVKSMP